jgi:hypothetical protein
MEREGEVEEVMEGGDQEEGKWRAKRPTFLTLIPAFLSPIACLFLNSVTIEIGFKPAFSANVVGITSRASAKAWKQYASLPLRVWACCVRSLETWISGAPPPAINALGISTISTKR